MFLCLAQPNRQYKIYNKTVTHVQFRNLSHIIIKYSKKTTLKYRAQQQKRQIKKTARALFKSERHYSA